jgi:hypothetical protein
MLEKILAAIGDAAPAATPIKPKKTPAAAAAATPAPVAPVEPPPAAAPAQAASEVAVPQPNYADVAALTGKLGEAGGPHRASVIQLMIEFGADATKPNLRQVKDLAAYFAKLKKLDAPAAAPAANPLV